MIYMNDSNKLKNCKRNLVGHHAGKRMPKAVFKELTAFAPGDLNADVYGSGKLINDFEEEIAAVLGKETAVFMPSGTMCQQIALRILTDMSGVSRVAFHPKSHLELHEYNAYREVMGLESILLGESDRLIQIKDLTALREPIGALLIELPQREIGGVLPSWEELKTITDWALEQDVMLHLDGARLWECQPFYNKPYAEIASLFDTVYVSFYKGLGGITGAVLAGPEEVIDEARIWQRRLGGNLYSLYPYVLSAKKSYEERLPKMSKYRKNIIKTFQGIEISPDPPHTNMMHVFVKAEASKLEKAIYEVVEETGVLIINKVVQSQIPAYQKFELWAGDATLDFSNKEIKDLFKLLTDKIKTKSKVVYLDH